jgi:6-phosphogluconate dehydrogenase
MSTPETGAKTAKIGMIGLAVMGENLAMNIERNGFPIAVFNRDPAKVDNFVARTPGKQVIPTQVASGLYSVARTAAKGDLTG